MLLRIRSALPFAVLVALAVCTPARADDAAPGAATPSHQFDFLLGEWEVSVSPKVSTLAAMIHGTPKLVGHWKAWRAFDGRGIEDELAVTDTSGNPIQQTRSLRVFDAEAAHWVIVSLDGLRAHPGESTGSVQKGVLQVDGKGVSGDGTAYLARSRYEDIGAEGFRLRQDRSFDNGATWEEDAIVVDAKKARTTP
jgi:hypothetical protein